MKKEKKSTMKNEYRNKNKIKLITGGSIGAIAGLLVIRGLLDYIGVSNQPHIYTIAIHIFASAIAIIGAIRLGKKSRKMKNSILLCVSIISFVSLYYLGDIMRSSYPQYIHIYKVPIVVGMIISMAVGILMLFSLSDKK